MRAILGIVVPTSTTSKSFPYEGTPYRADIEAGQFLYLGWTTGLRVSSQRLREPAWPRRDNHRGYINTPCLVAVGSYGHPRDRRAVVGCGCCRGHASLCHPESVLTMARPRLSPLRHLWPGLACRAILHGPLEFAPSACSAGNR